MMDDYISRQELKNQMYHEAFEKDSDMQRWDSGCWIRYKLFENCIESIPSAPVREVKRGRWLDGYCSCCGKRTVWDETDFCPNCGADNRENGE